MLTSYPVTPSHPARSLALWVVTTLFIDSSAGPRAGPRAGAPAVPYPVAAIFGLSVGRGGTAARRIKDTIDQSVRCGGHSVQKK